MEQKRQVQVHITRTPGIKLFQIQDWVREKLGLRIATTAAERIRHAPANEFLATGRKLNRKVLFPVFEAAFFAVYRLNDGKAILIDDLLLEKSRSIQAAQGISENDLRLSNGWLHKSKTQHGIKQHVLRAEADSVERALPQWIEWSLKR